MCKFSWCILYSCLFKERNKGGKKGCLRLMLSYNIWMKDLPIKHYSKLTCFSTLFVDLKKSFIWRALCLKIRPSQVYCLKLHMNLKAFIFDLALTRGPPSQSMTYGLSDIIYHQTKALWMSFERTWTDLLLHIYSHPCQNWFGLPVVQWGQSVNTVIPSTWQTLKGFKCINRHISSLFDNASVGVKCHLTVLQLQFGQGTLIVPQALLRWTLSQLPNDCEVTLLAFNNIIKTAVDK